MEENLIRKIPNPTVAQILDAYIFEEDEVELKWQLYLRGDLLAIEPYREPALKVIDVSDLELAVSGEFDDYEFVNVGSYSDTWSFNFMGYHNRRRCYAFKGEMRLLKLFLAFLGDMFSSRRVEMAIVKPNCLMFPLDGLNEGFTHQEYQDKIKIAECVLFIRDGATNVSPDSFREAAAAAAEPSSPVAAVGGDAVAGAALTVTNGMGTLASVATNVMHNGSNGPEETQEDAHQRYNLRQRNRPSHGDENSSNVTNGANGSSGINGANLAGSSNAPGTSNGRRR